METPAACRIRGQSKFWMNCGPARRSQCRRSSQWQAGMGGQTPSLDGPDKNGTTFCRKFPQAGLTARRRFPAVPG